jgi:hypothetical protein
VRLHDTPSWRGRTPQDRGSVHESDQERGRDGAPVRRITPATRCRRACTRGRWRPRAHRHARTARPRGPDR